MIKNVNDFFVKADNICDYVPMVSTLSNLADLFQKNIITSSMNENSVKNSYYYSHLKQKSILRCICLLIPVIGNITIGFYDISNSIYVKLSIVWQIEKMRLLAEMRRRNDSHKLRSDIFAAFRGNSEVLKKANILPDDKDFVQYAIFHDFQVINASEKLNNNKEFVLYAIVINARAIELASQELQNDKEFIFGAIQINYRIINYVCNKFKEDKDVVLAAALHEYSVVKNSIFKNDKHFIFSVIIKLASKRGHNTYVSPIQKNLFSLLDETYLHFNILKRSLHSPYSPLCFFNLDIIHEITEYIFLKKFENVALHPNF